MRGEGDGDRGAFGNRSQIVTGSPLAHVFFAGFITLTSALSRIREHSASLSRAHASVEWVMDGDNVNETKNPAAAGLLVGMEARGGLEPPNRGFADLSLSLLGTAP